MGQKYGKATTSNNVSKSRRLRPRNPLERGWREEGENESGMERKHWAEKLELDPAKQFETKEIMIR